MGCGLYGYIFWCAEDGCCVVRCGDIGAEGKYGLVSIMEVLMEELVLVCLECSVVV